jgi:hypothetical protein
MNDNLTTNVSNEAQSPAFLVGAVVSRFFRWFKISCPKCNEGKLTQDDIHHCWGGGELNVYSCDNCKSQFV